MGRGRARGRPADRRELGVEIGFGRDAQMGELAGRCIQVALVGSLDGREQRAELAGMGAEGGLGDFRQRQLVQDVAHRHVEQGIEQREGADHEGHVARVFQCRVEAQAGHEQFDQAAAGSSFLQQRRRVLAVVRVGVNQQLQPALQLPAAKQVDGLAKAGDRAAR